MMEGVIFCCPPAWRKLLPPGVLGAERAEALAEQYWPLLVLTRRGCGELGDTAALCRVLLVPGDCTAPLERITAETVVTYGLSSRDSLTLSSLAEPVLASSGSCLGRAAAWWSPGISPAELRLRGGAAAAAGPAAVAAATDKCPLCVGRLKTKKGGCNMAWHEILATGIILAGTAFYCWAAYSRKSGPTSCIGCGKCVADGVCILTGKKVPGISGGKGKNL